VVYFWAVFVASLRVFVFFECCLLVVMLLVLLYSFVVIFGFWVGFGDWCYVIVLYLFVCLGDLLIA